MRFPAMSMDTPVTLSIDLYTRSLFLHATQEDENVGPPTSAVKMPIGKSAKGMMVREPISAPAIRSTPPSADAGINTAFDGPATALTMCGMTRPRRSEEHTSELQSRGH